jgi:hypothetical protein
MLNPVLQDGKKLPKWVPRAHRGQYLIGVSGDHATTIGRIRNVWTGHISLQFHVVYDDLYTTVLNVDITPNVPDAEAIDLETLLESHGVRDHYVDESFDKLGNALPVPELDVDYLTDEGELEQCWRRTTRRHPLGRTRLVRTPQREQMGQNEEIPNEVEPADGIDPVSNVEGDFNPPDDDGPSDNSDTNSVVDMRTPEEQSLSEERHYNRCNMLCRSQRQRKPNRNAYGGKGGAGIARAAVYTTQEKSNTLSSTAPS